MKLVEIVSIPSVSNIDHAHSFMAAVHGRGEHTLPSGKQIKILGSGVEAVAFKEPGEIGVVKVMTTRSANLSNNPYIRYISIARRYAKENPYLPRIDLVTKQQFSFSQWAELRRLTGTEAEPEVYYNHPPYLLSFKMERLIPLNTLDTDQLRALYYKTFGRQLSSLFKEQMQIVHKIATHIQIIVHTGEISETTDPLLLRAITIINSVKVRSAGMFDLHAGNMMVRVTVGGPQLVITDPIYRQ